MPHWLNNLYNEFYKRRIMIKNKNQLAVIQDAITNRTFEDIYISKENLIKVSTYIKQLNSHINGNIELSSNKIYNMLTWLQANFTLNLIYKLDEGKVVLRRARKYEEKNSKSFCYKHVQDLVCIPENQKDIAPLGRMNKAKEPMYYGVISHSHFNRFDTVLSEVDALEYDVVNILDSMLDETISTCHMGAFDLYIRYKKLPDHIHDFNGEAYQYLIDSCDENKFLLDSYILCNAFFADILSRKKQGNLHQVTSTLSSIIFENKNIDSIIYESVQVKNAPVIVIKPEIVYEKMKHEAVVSFQVKSNLGYGLYYGDELYKGKITNNSYIEWDYK